MNNEVDHEYLFNSVASANTGCNSIKDRCDDIDSEANEIHIEIRGKNEKDDNIAIEMISDIFLSFFVRFFDGCRCTVLFFECKKW